MSIKNSNDTFGIEPATFRLAAQWTRHAYVLHTGRLWNSPFHHTVYLYVLHDLEQTVLIALYYTSSTDRFL